MTSITYLGSAWGKGVEPNKTTAAAAHPLHNPLDLWRPLLVVAVQITILNYLHDAIFASGQYQFDLARSIAVPLTVTTVYLTFVAWGLYRLKRAAKTTATTPAAPAAGATTGTVSLSLYSLSHVRECWSFSYGRLGKWGSC